MKKISNYLKQLNIIYILIITAAMIIGYILFHSNIYSPYSDIGREFYIPSQINGGYALYQDIFNVYTPLGYIINALFIKLFGNNFAVFYIIGFVCSTGGIISIFLISKEYTNKNIALFISLFIIFSCIYFPSVSNWITPYSYSLLYALLAILWSFFFFYKFFDEGKISFLYIAWFLFGFSLSCKYEYIAFFIVLTVGMIYSKLKTNVYLKSIACFLSIPSITLLILFFIQKCSFNAIISGIKYIFCLSNSFSAKWFYIYSGIIPTVDSLNNSILSLKYPHFTSIFYSLGYIGVILLIYTLIKIFIKRKENTKEDILYAILIVTAVLTSIKSIGAISLEIYGTYFLPLLFISLCVFLYKYVLKKKSIILIIICIILSSSYFLYDIKHNNLQIIATEKGNIKIPSVFLETTNQVISYIQENTEKKDKILILPEGVLINYITNRSSDNYLFYLIPPNCEIFTDEFINYKIEKNKPEYIIISNIQYPWYGQTSFCNSWGKNICNFIKDLYNLEKVIGKDFKFYIYKLK